MAEAPTYNEEANTNQPLIVNEKPKQESNPFILPPESKNQDEIHIPYKKGCFTLLITLVVVFIIFSIIPGVTVFIQITIIISFITLICLFSCLCCIKNKLIILKDVKNNSLIIKQKNYLCCSKQYKFPLDNSTFFCEEIEDFESSQINSMNIVIINILINKNEIDLDNSTIKDVPLKLFHTFDNLKVDKDLELKLNNFINSPGYINDEPNEYNKYLFRYKKKRIFFSTFNKKKRLDYFLKISEFFYSYHNIRNELFIRIDWIYSTNFDRIFIGIVKNDNSYLKTFIYNINSIDKLAMQNNDKGFSFKIIFNDQDNEEICLFKNENNYYFEHFLFLFNGKLEDVKGNHDNAPPQTIQSI